MDQRSDAPLLTRGETERRKPDPTIFARAAGVAGVDQEKRTADVVWTTGARVKRYNWRLDEYYWEELSLERGHVRLDRLNGGAPVLNAHSAWDLRDVIGVVEPGTAAVNGKEGRATLRFSKREDVEPIWTDVRDGIVRSVSVGYRSYKYERKPPENPNDLPVYRITDWEPLEISPVPIPADPGAGFRAEDLKDVPFPAEEVSRAAAHNQEVHEMDEEQKKAAAAEAARKEQEKKEAEQRSVAQAEAEAKARAEAAKAERARIAEIETIARTAELGDAFKREHVEAGTAVEKVRELAFAKMAERSAQNPIRGANRVELGTEEHERTMARVADAVAVRAAPHLFRLEGERAEAVREFRGLTLMELARDLLERRGVKTRHMSRMQLAGAALGLDAATRASVIGAQGTSDLANVLANVMNKTLRMQYEGTRRTFLVWARQSTNPDFKTISRTVLSGAPSLLQVNESGEYKRGSVSDGKETYSLATYGRTVAFSRQALINDDLNALTRMPQLMGQAAADLESDTVYGVITTNGNLADGTALFASGHSNLAGSGGAISVTTLGAGRSAMRQQTGLEGRKINLAPRFLLVPTAIEQTAYQYTSSQYVPAKSSDINEFRAGGRTALEPVVEPRLDDNSATAWYLAADPAQIDTVEYCYLEGNEGVYTETRVGFEVDGVEMKVRHDFAAKALDHRGLYKNPGA